mmetsp:Transcript_2150/g.5705  ORF Transcript_2150/g.5705 Transcript_2150/m.5705 type:complete len:317 (-) Transcript_2150:25-975(-)
MYTSRRSRGLGEYRNSVLATCASLDMVVLPLSFVNSSSGTRLCSTRRGMTFSASADTSKYSRDCVMLDANNPSSVVTCPTTSRTSSNVSDGKCMPSRSNSSFNNTAKRRCSSFNCSNISAREVTAANERYRLESELSSAMYPLSMPKASSALFLHSPDAWALRQSSAASMTEHTVLEISSRRWRVSIAFDTVEEAMSDDRREERIERRSSHSDDASRARRTKSGGDRSPGREKRPEDGSAGGKGTGGGGGGSGEGGSSSAAGSSFFLFSDGDDPPPKRLPRKDDDDAPLSSLLPPFLPRRALSTSGKRTPARRDRG